MPSNPGTESLEDQRNKLERMAEEKALEMLASEKAYEITAPIYDMAVEEKITWDQANKEGTFPMVVEPYRVPDPKDRKNKEGYVLPTEPILMVAGRGVTKDKAVADWIKRHKGYGVREFNPNAELVARLRTQAATVGSLVESE